MNIKIDFKIFIFILLFLFTNQSTIYLLILTFSLLHELGHLAMGLCLGLKAKMIKIMPMRSINFIYYSI